MLPRPLLQLTISYLDYQDLARLSQVGALYNQHASDSNLWKRETLRMLSGDHELFSVIGIESNTYRSTLDWKKIFREVITSRNFWFKIDQTLLTAPEAFGLYSELLGALQNPPFPLPMLRRESRCFPTFLQELIAYPEDTNEVIEMTTSRDFIEEFVHNHAMVMLYQIGEQDQELLQKARWCLKEMKEKQGISRNSLESDSILSTIESVDQPELSIKNSQSAVLQIYAAIKKSTKSYCQLVKGVLWDCTEETDFLHLYCTYWQAFTASITEISKAYESYSQLLQEIYEQFFQNSLNSPKFSIMRLMTFIWRRVIYDTFSDRIKQSTAALIREQRSEYLKGDKTVSSIRILMIQAVQSLLDLSLHELNIHYSQEDNFLPTGAYKFLHDIILDDSQMFYLSIPVEQIQEVVKADTCFLSMLALPCTVVEMEKIVGKIMIERIEEGALELVCAFNRNSYRCPSYVSNLKEREMIGVSKFGSLLLNVGLEYGKIIDFLGFMQREFPEQYELIASYNMLVDALSHSNAVEVRQYKDEDEEMFRFNYDLTAQKLRMLQELPEYNFV